MADKLEQERKEELDLLKSKLSQIQQKLSNEYAGEMHKNLTKLTTQKALQHVERGKGIQTYL